MTQYWKIERIDSFRAGKCYQVVLGIDRCDGFETLNVGRFFNQKRNAEKFCRLANREMGARP